VFGLIYILIGYLLGSIPSAYIAGRLAKGIDIRKSGDGNVGAANAFREIGPRVGLAVMAVDVLKGSAAVIIAQSFTSQPVVFLTGFAAVAGHIWPLYIGFKGGRGEATAAGVLAVLLPQAMLILLGIAAIPFILTRNAMLLGAMLFAPLWLAALLMGASAALISFVIGLPCMVGIIHFLTTRRLAAHVRSQGKYFR
jgi:glycerol-3-phosphate acyltransferase PlsY